MRELIARVNDPYGKFIEVKPMKRTQQNIRGVGVGTGLTLRRTWHLEHLKYALIRVLLPWQRQGALHTVDTQVVNIADNGNKTLLRSLHRIGDYIATCSLAVLPSAGLLWKGSPSKRLLWVLSSTLFFTFFVATKVYPWIRPIEVVSILHPTNENNVRVGDKIVSINQKEVGLRSIKRINKVMNNGEVGEMVDIEVLRTSETSLFTLHKTKLVKDFVPQTKIDHFALLKNRLGYIAIKEFNEESFRDFTKAFDELKNEIKENSGESMQGVVIDLRGNPGGTMVSALDIAALFLRRGSTLTQLSFNGRVEQCKSKNGKADLVTPILLLVDSLTASASEILVEALCDNERASSAGVKTVGKNLAQVTYKTPIICKTKFH